MRGLGFLPPGRKYSTKTLSRRPDAGQSYASGCSVNKILEPSQRRQVVEHLHGSYRVNEQRACRVSSFPLPLEGQPNLNFSVSVNMSRRSL